MTQPPLAGEGLTLAGPPRPTRWGLTLDVIDGTTVFRVDLDADAVNRCSCGAAAFCRHIAAALRQGGAACSS